MSSYNVPIPAFSQRSALRKDIIEAIRKPEIECVENLTKSATFSSGDNAAIESLAVNLASVLRDKRHPGLVETLVQEFSLSSEEGVALMCLAEALLRVPDNQTRDALIDDKIGYGDWMSHFSSDRPLFANAAAWGLSVTSGIVAPHREKSLKNALLKFVKTTSRPVIRNAINFAMHLMGNQFVLGETIEKARKNSIKLEKEGFCYSYDMLGEAAYTAHDAERYHKDYTNAIHVIGRTATGKTIYERPGISIKLSALHPRYSRAQRDRVMTELLPIVVELTLLCKEYNISINIDAEESERLDISLDLLEALCKTDELQGWNGIGFVVQAYGKRCPYVLDYLINLARTNKQRLMIRLVKGAYWDSEIKKTQVEGLSDFPVFTRKCHTDISYTACARKLLEARDAVFPQFATHNARTVATIYTMAGKDFEVGSYEFQCLHGMGEDLYRQVVGPHKLNRPSRIYAPVGTHETLLAYLVRRLLENGANSSFVNQIGDKEISIEELIEDPVKTAHKYKPYGGSHPEVKKPSEMFEPTRKNSKGIDFADDKVLETLYDTMEKSPKKWFAKSLIDGHETEGQAHPVVNPSNHNEPIGDVVFSTPNEINIAVDAAESGFEKWKNLQPSERADILDKASDLLEDNQDTFLYLLSHEAGKSLPNGIAEVREAIDFLRYYSAQIRENFKNETYHPLGPVVCISPWNFPLAIFVGQIAAALAAGNSVLAKPAEETPIIAYFAVQLLHKAGIPSNVLQLLLGEGDIGAALVASPKVNGVMFTGSTSVAQSISKELEKRRLPSGQPVVFIAETGGQNAMIVDSTALAEQVTVDVLASAFDSAGQRCSALRLLCIQEDCADHVLKMIRGAMEELSLGNPFELSTDIGPVITPNAANMITKHVERFKKENDKNVFSTKLKSYCENGSFIAPTIINIEKVSDMGGEVFGPVLHVLRYKRRNLPNIIADLNKTGYGLTFGIHTRIEGYEKEILKQVNAGNLYVNRNIIGAIVGVQPFGGRGLSGTGPKAGGPLALRRLLSEVPQQPEFKAPKEAISDSLIEWQEWLQQQNAKDSYEYAHSLAENPLPSTIELPGPVGEKNLYSLSPRKNILCLSSTKEGLYNQISLLLACQNTGFLWAADEKNTSDLPEFVKQRLEIITQMPDAICPVILSEDDDKRFADTLHHFIERDDAPIPLAWITHKKMPPIEAVLQEQSCSVNTTAAGGNASLMTLT